MITLGMASRGRPKLFERAMRSVVERTLDASAVEVVVRVDSDDPELKNYQREWPIAVRFIEKPRGIVGAAPYINEAIIAGRGDVRFQFTDDQTIETHGWDCFVERYAIKDRPMVYAYEEKWAVRGNPGVNDKWLQKVGCFYPPEGVHFHVDTALFELGETLGMIQQLPIVIQHHKGVHDALYGEIRTRPQNREAVENWKQEVLGKMK